MGPRLRVIAAALVVASTWAACGDGDGDGSGRPAPRSTASATPGLTITSTPAADETPDTESIEDDVREAYLAYWEAYAAALLDLDASLVDDFAADRELEEIRDEIEKRRAEGVAVRVVVEHSFVVRVESPERAVVVDRIVNNSFFVDPSTKEPPTASGSGDILQDTFELEKRDGRWVVVRSTRQS